MEDNQLLLNWSYFSQEKSMEELKESLLCTTLELETTKLQAQQDLENKDYQITHLKNLLHNTVIERNVAQQQLVILQRKQEQQPSISTVSSSDCDESIVSYPITKLPFIAETNLGEESVKLGTARSLLLPKQGRFLQAVMKAGPLLETLLVAGPLPEWRHPPPILECFQIPPVNINI